MYLPPTLPAVESMHQPQGRESEVKTVDFSAFTDNSNKQRVSDAILSSLKSIGFVYITNHGLPEEDVQNMFKWVQSSHYRFSLTAL